MINGLITSVINGLITSVINGLIAYVINGLITCVINGLILSQTDLSIIIIKLIASLITELIIKDGQSSRFIINDYHQVDC